MINLNVGDDMDLWKLKAIFNDKNRFLTLNEIYEEFSERYDISQYSDYKAAIRTEIYRNCIDRDLNTANKNTFVSFALKVENQFATFFELFVRNAEVWQFFTVPCNFPYLLFV